MKKVAKGPEPSGLIRFRSRLPNATWAVFKRSEPSTYDQVVQLLRKDQGGLCCYCEIDLRPPLATSSADFRVEHFHPKSDGRPWHLAWDNLLGCCHGGSQKTVPDRYSADHSCDVPKAGDVLDTVILNPLHLPLARLFNFERTTGKLSAFRSKCNEYQIDPERVEETLSRLNLNCPRLCQLRKAAADQLNAQLQLRLSRGQALAEVRIQMAKAIFINGQDWPAFFTALRAYLGEGAELRLTELGYQG